MSSDPNKKSTDTGTNSGTEVLRLPDSMPDNMPALGAPVENVAFPPFTGLPSLGTPLSQETDVTPPVQINIAPVSFDPPTPIENIDDATAPHDISQFQEITAVTQIHAFHENEITAVTPAPNFEITAPVEASDFNHEVTDITFTPMEEEEPTAIVEPTSTAKPVVKQDDMPTDISHTFQKQNFFSKNTKRIALAAAISASGFIFTIAWYRLGAGNVHGPNSKAIAKIIRSLNEVQRKPITKLIWQPIFDKDIIYTGEAIRTAATAEATIEFLDSGTRIDLDPDSAIVLEESAGKLALNFLQGNLLVKAGTGSGAGAGGVGDITLKTGEKQIALGNSELSLGKSASGQLDLQVLKGQAQVVGGGKTLTLAQGTSLDGLALALTKPTGDDTIYIEPDSKEKVMFEWVPLTQGDYTVTLEAGPTRFSMKAVAGAMATGTAGKLEAELKTGRIYYRLVARSANPAFKELTSAVVKNTVIAKVPPLPITPENDVKLAISHDHPSVAFAWSNSANLAEVYFKLARTPDFKVLLSEKTVKNGQNNLSYDFTASGKYYWQLTGKANGKTIAQSKVVSFDLNITKGLPSPHLIKPLELEKITYDTFKESGLLLSWEQVANAAKYNVTIESKGANPIYVETELLQYRVKDLKPGSYSWTVLAVNDKGDLSPSPEKRQFQLVELPLVPWADGKNLSEFQYITLKPSVDLQWVKPAAPATRYSVHLTPEANEGETTVSFAATSGTIPLTLDGSYFAEIEAFDSNNKLVARSQRRQVKVGPAPLLPPPLFAEGIPAEITASGNGGAALSWSNVQGASKYILTLKNDKGEPKRELAFTSSEGQLRGLMPGEYKVVLRSIDQHGRPGPEGEERVLKVPNVSNVRAPKLKGLKVK